MPEKFDLFPSLALYERLGVPYVMWSNHGHNNYEGALWTGQVMMLADDTYGDIGHAHELFHWWIAPEEKRPYPDFALGRQVNGGAKFFTASGLPLYDRQVRSATVASTTQDGARRRFRYPKPPTRRNSPA